MGDIQSLDSALPPSKRLSLSIYIYVYEAAMDYMGERLEEMPPIK